MPQGRAIQQGIHLHVGVRYARVREKSRVGSRAPKGCNTRPPPLPLIGRPAFPYDVAIRMAPIDIDGLTYIPEFLSREEHDCLVNIIDNNPFSSAIHRRQQFYGETYYHTTPTIASIQPKVSEERVGALPIDAMQWLINKIVKETKTVFDQHPPTQCLVNEYVRNQGIASHFDDALAFGPIVASISLVNPIIFTLKLPKEHTNQCQDILETHQLYLEPRSLLLMEREARYNWRHGITKTKHIQNPFTKEWTHRNESYRRLSITIRHVLDGRKRSSG